MEAVWKLQFEKSPSVKSARSRIALLKLELGCLPLRSKLPVRFDKTSRFAHLSRRHYPLGHQDYRT